MKLTELIRLIERELADNGDTEVVIYDSSGDRITPRGFYYGGMSTDHGFVDTVSFSDLE